MVVVNGRLLGKKDEQNMNIKNTTEEEETQEILTESEEEQDDERKEPVHWFHRSPVVTRNLPLEPDLLTQQVFYQTKKGNITIIDRKYACLRVGSLLTSLGFTVESLEDPEFSRFIEDCLSYSEYGYRQDVEEIQNRQAQEQFVETAIKMIPSMKKIARAKKQFEKLEWTQEQWIEHIRATS